MEMKKVTKEAMQEVMQMKVKMEHQKSKMAAQ